MTIAYCCMLLVVLLPYLWVALAKFGRSDDGVARRYNNYAPREQQAKLAGYRARAVWAQNNAFEAMPGFLAAVLLASQLGVGALEVNVAAVVFVLARVLHGLCYLANLAWQRSLAWSVGLVAVIYLFGLSILQLA